VSLVCHRPPVRPGIFRRDNGRQLGRRFVSGFRLTTAFTWQHAGPINASGAPVASYNPLAVPAYTLVDLRAGIEKDAWRFQIWGHNVTNQYYWTGAEHVNDMLLRYTGMPVTYGFTLSYRYH